MNDVIPEVGGFLVIRIDRFGYMRNAADEKVVHRETRDLHRDEHCLSSFVAAKSKLSEHAEIVKFEEHAILELTKDGGGAFVWMPETQREKLEDRLQRFRGCYGGWPIRTLSI